MEQYTKIPDPPFIVRESRILNVIIGVFMGTMAVSFFVYVGLNLFSFVFFLMGLIFIGVGIRKRIVLLINEVGIFYYGTLLTTWINFIRAHYQEEEYNTGEGVNRAYFLYIEYYKDSFDSSYISRIIMTSALNKAEEDIITAIEKYHTEYSSLSQ